MRHRAFDHFWLGASALRMASRGAQAAMLVGFARPPFTLER
jgi:hypothetical protein